LGYGNFSAGEKQRCDLALLFAFLELSKLKTNFKSNVIFFDELFASLDESGLNGLGKIFDKMTQEGTSIFVITHDDKVKEMGDATMIITKDKFSKVSYE
jgi:DNA repair exonuclease SbcCD ATPase subunit